MSQFLSALTSLSFSASSNLTCDPLAQFGYSSPAALQIKTNVLFSYILPKTLVKR